MRLFDTHAHINDERFDNDREQMIQDCFDQGVEYIMCPAVDRQTAESAIALAEQYDRVYAAVGVHPHESKDATEEDYAWIKQMASHPKVKAIGEIGLDYYYDFSDRDVQAESFKRHLAIAREVDLPIIIHDRLLIETDSPYLTPPPFRGRRNDPSKTQFVAQEIAQLRGMDVEELAAIALENGKRCFGIE